MTATLERSAPAGGNNRYTLRQNLRLLFPGLSIVELGTLVVWYSQRKVLPPENVLDGLCSPTVWARMWTTPNKQYTDMLVAAVNPHLRYAYIRPDGEFLMYVANH